MTSNWGWQYVNGEPHWRPNIETAMAEITGGLYGEEYEDRRRELDELVDAVRREWAAKLRELEPETPEGFTLRETWLDAWREGRNEAADILDPDTGGPERGSDRHG